MRISEFLRNKKISLTLGITLVVALTSLGVAAYFYEPAEPVRHSATANTDTHSNETPQEQGKKNNDKDPKDSEPAKDNSSLPQENTTRTTGSSLGATRPSPPTPQGYKPWQPPVARDFTLSSGSTITLSPGSVSGTVTATMNDGSVVSWHGSPRVYQGATPPEAVGQLVVMVIENGQPGSVFNFHIWVSPDATPASYGLLVSAYDNPGATISSKWLTVVIQ